jgi:hypothetical protein
MSDLTRLRQLIDDSNSAAARTLSLELLHKSRKREVIEAALRALENVELDDSARPVLREKIIAYMDNPGNDKTLFVREKIARMLTNVGSPNDTDIYRRGVNTYEIQPFLGEVAHNFRAVSLVGLGIADQDEGSLYATKLLSEIDSTSVFNGEPAVTAINLLFRQNKILPIYQYLLIGGLDALEVGHNEVVGKALESLGENFPVELYKSLTELFLPRDRAVVNMGIISHIVEHKVEPLYNIVEGIITQTRHDDLHHYGVVMLAASRDPDLIARLYALAKITPKHRIENFVEAVGLTPGEEKDDLLAFLKRKRG